VFSTLSRLCVCVIALAVTPAPQGQSQETAKFRSGIDLISVTATVTDGEGRLVTDLRREDFSVYEDGTRQTLTQFTRERVPVSLGILLDASGSMNSEKLQAAKSAIGHLAFDLLEKEDELFFVEFGFNARMTQGWTNERKLIRHALEDVSHPSGDTALYDAIALALPTAQEGRHVKKALLVISDGNDSRSLVTLPELRQAIIESDVLVYALGIDNPPGARQYSERLDANTLRQITDDTGGRTEAVRGAAALDAAIARIANELRQQYSLGYSTAVPRDGRPHELRVEVRDRRLKVRARRNFIAS
jgi:Ca-activated chloride channel family protein